MAVDDLISPDGCGSLIFAGPSANLVFEVLRLCLYGWGCPPSGCEVQIELLGMFRGIYQGGKMLNQMLEGMVLD